MKSINFQEISMECSLPAGQPVHLFDCGKECLFTVFFNCYAFRSAFQDGHHQKALHGVRQVQIRREIPHPPGKELTQPRPHLQSVLVQLQAPVRSHLGPCAGNPPDPDGPVPEHALSRDQ